MDEALCRASALLADCYPRAHTRERALRWLGWIAYHWGDEPVAWWEIPARIPGRWLARARFAVAAAIVVAALCAATAFGRWVAVMVIILATVVLVADGRLPRPRPLRIPQAGPARRVARARPVKRTEIAALALSLIPVVSFLPVLLHQWTGLADGDATGTYRADRRTAAAHVAAWLGSGGLVAAIVCGAGVPFGAWFGVVVSLALSAGLLAALVTGPYPLVKLTELILLAQWRQPVSFHRVLADAAKAQVLEPAGGRWRFRDEAMRAALAAAHDAELRERELARQARAALVTGMRARLVAAMDARGIARTRADLSGGVALFFLLLGVVLARGQDRAWGLVVLYAIIAAGAGAVCYVFAPRPLRRAVACVRWTVVNVPPFARRTRLLLAAAGIGAAALLIAVAGSALAALAAAVLPGALVAVCGSWLLLVIRRHRYLADTVAAAATGTGLLALARPDVLAAGPLTGLLFPVAAWASLRAWRAMNASGRLSVRAVADLALSLLLGANLVLFLVWLANLLDLTRPEVAAARGTLERAGSLADLPWWLWTGLYAALTVTAVAFATWPARLTRASKLAARLRLLPGIDVVRRVLTGVHVGLLVIVAVAVAAPAAVFPVLRDQLAARYTVAYQRQLESAGEQTAYLQIRGQFATANANHDVLDDLVDKIHHIDRPPPGADHATATEQDIARRVGLLQAATMLATTAPPPASTTAQDTASTEFTAPIADEKDLRTRLTKLDDQEKKDDAAHKRAEQAGELAAVTIASLLSVPDVGGNEVVQIVREYLSGLIEGSSLKDVFAAWTAHLTGADRPPRVDTLVVPQPVELEEQALRTHLKEFLKNPSSATLPSTAHESALDAAVDLANQTRYLSEGGAGPCAGCTHVENHDEPFHEPVDVHPVP